MDKTGLIKNSNYRKALFASLIIGLLLLRFPLEIIPYYVDIGISSMTRNVIFQDGTYLLTAIILILERDRLTQFKLNFFGVAIFILAPIFKMIAYLFLDYKVLTSSIWELWFPLCISVFLIEFFIFNNKSLKIDNFKYHVKWIVLSILVGIVGCIGVEYMFKLIDPVMKGPVHTTFTILLCSFITQLSTAAVVEEPLFRGFIWGLLEKRGWKQYWIWLFQAGLFAIGHIFYITAHHPIYLIGTFVSALIFGLLVWRSKSTGTGMIAHGIHNSLYVIIYT